MQMTLFRSLLCRLQPFVFGKYRTTFDTFFCGFHMMILTKLPVMKGNTMQEFAQEMKNDKFPIGMAYVPWQKFEEMYQDLEKAYCVGTIFPELNKPFTGRRCV